MKMKKLTAMGMAALMAATMIPAVPVMAEGEGLSLIHISEPTRPY